jgi:hypothetical protein
MLQLLDSRLAAALSGDFMGRLRTALPRSRTSSIMSRNAALAAAAAASRSSSNLIVIQAPGISARSDLRWRSERTWNSNGPVSAASMAVKHGSAWTYQGGLQLNYGLHPRRPATASSYATVGRQLSRLYQLIPTNGFGSVKPGLVGLSIRCNVRDACGIRMAASRRAQRHNKQARTNVPVFWDRDRHGRWRIV